MRKWHFYQVAFVDCLAQHPANKFKQLHPLWLHGSCVWVRVEPVFCGCHKEAKVGVEGLFDDFFQKLFEDAVLVYSRLETR